MTNPISPDKEVERLTTELETTRRQLQQLKEDQRIKDKEMENFAYVVSHDLKSPLASILLTSEMLREYFGETIDGDNDQLLKVMNRAIFKIKNLADGILAYYRAERTMNDITETFDLTSSMQMLVEILKPGPAAEIHYPREEILICTNKAAMEQILNNLLQNALQYNDKERKILHIRFREAGSFYYFEVQDNGRGIAAADQQRIFELFTSLGTDPSAVPGLGIGLTITRKLVEKLGGEISLRSIPAEGSVFEFSIKK
jgi:signal transduction histidine kinase